jgi:hypothetical protein
LSPINPEDYVPSDSGLDFDIPFWNNLANEVERYKRLYEVQVDSNDTLYPPLPPGAVPTTQSGIPLKYDQLFGQGGNQYTRGRGLAAAATFAASLLEPFYTAGRLNEGNIGSSLDYGTEFSEDHSLVALAVERRPVDPSDLPSRTIPDDEMFSGKRVVTPTISYDPEQDQWYEYRVVIHNQQFVATAQVLPTGAQQNYVVNTYIGSTSSTLWRKSLNS